LFKKIVNFTLMNYYFQPYLPRVMLLKTRWPQCPWCNNSQTLVSATICTTRRLHHTVSTGWNIEGQWLKMIKSGSRVKFCRKNFSNFFWKKNFKHFFDQSGLCARETYLYLDLFITFCMVALYTINKYR
jgi:hypothetical protein